MKRVSRDNALRFLDKVAPSCEAALQKQAGIGTALLAGPSAIAKYMLGGQAIRWLADKAGAKPVVEFLDKIHSPVTKMNDKLFRAVGVNPNGLTRSLYETSMGMALPLAAYNSQHLLSDDNPMKETVHKYAPLALGPAGLPIFAARGIRSAAEEASKRTSDTIADEVEKQLPIAGSHVANKIRTQADIARQKQFHTYDNDDWKQNMLNMLADR